MEAKIPCGRPVVKDEILVHAGGHRRQGLKPRHDPHQWPGCPHQWQRERHQPRWSFEPGKNSPDHVAVGECFAARDLIGFAEPVTLQGRLAGRGDVVGMDGLPQARRGAGDRVAAEAAE